VSAISIITAACDISSLTVLGELPEPVLQWWGLPEHVRTVQADNRVMFHWSEPEHPEGPGDLRADTATYQWVGWCCRAIIANPYALLRETKRDRCKIILIGRVEPPSPQYATVQYMRLVVKYVPSTQEHPPELWLDTYTPHSENKELKRHLKKAVLVSALPSAVLPMSPPLERRKI
jgi:hypothetical protein